ncbi:MAG: cell wall-binding repeat-containing protein [Bacillus sp. (in: Bacteria)]|nr:cell wall-binding repeat-containing protein [Bacillus sp. (in: firmicutes)]
MKNIIILAVLSMTFLFMAACTTADEGAESTETPVDTVATGEQETEDNSSEPEVTEESKRGLLHLNTKNITRLNSDNPIEVSVMTSQTIWPATHETNQPGTIMLAPLDHWQLSLASLNLVHHPNDGPLLFTVDGSIPPLVMEEIERLQPKGNVDGVEIMVLGTMADGELDKLAGFEVQQIDVMEPAAFAYEIDKVYAELIQDVPSSVIIGSMEDAAKEFTIPAGSWITHMDESLLYVTKNEIPEETIAALEKREGAASIYVVGPESVVSSEVVELLGEFGQVTRIDGETPAQVSIAFAKFKDADTSFGWGVNKPGHGLVLVSTEIPELAITAAPFAHLGKHAPMVWLEDGVFTEEMHNYLELLKPTFKHDPTEGGYNHGYLIGGEGLVSFQTQGYLDEMLEIVPADGGGHAGHGAHGGH